MSKGTVLFDTYVIKSILANNQFGITSVTEIRSLNTRYFIKDEYPEIEKLIKSKDIETIKSLPVNKSEMEEYIDVMLFKDQDLKEYIVTVYDSNALEQDPQVIEIYSL